MESSALELVVSSQDVLPRNGDEDSTSTMSQLGCINDAAICNALVSRLRQGKPYAGSGVMLLYANPRTELLCELPSLEHQSPGDKLAPGTASGAAGPAPWVPVHGVRMMREAFQLGVEARAKLRHDFAPGLAPASARATGERIAQAAGLSRSMAALPHVFSVVDEAMREAVLSSAPQAVLVAGTSGSGKSEVLRHGVRYLAVASVARRLEAASPDAAASAIERAAEDLSCAAGDDAPSIEHVLTAGMHVVYAMTSAAAPSSPSGSTAHVRLTASLSEAGVLARARVEAHIVDAERLARGTSLGYGSRSFAILYQMVSGLDAAEKQRLGLSSVSELVFLDCEGYDTAAMMKDANDFQETLHSLQLCGFSAPARSALWQTLTAVLLLGQLRIERNAEAAAGPADESLESPASQPAAATGLASGWSFLNPATALLASRLLGLEGTASLMTLLASAAASRNCGPTGPSSRRAGPARSAQALPADLQDEAVILARELFKEAVQSVVDHINGFLDELGCGAHPERASTPLDADDVSSDGSDSSAADLRGAAIAPAQDSGPPAPEGPAVVFFDSPGLSLAGLVQNPPWFAPRPPGASAEGTDGVATFGTLLSNYAAERVEAKVRDMTLELDMGVYDAEGVDVGIPRDAIPESNEAVLRLYEDRAAPSGVFHVIEEEAKYSTSSAARSSSTPTAASQRGQTWPKAPPAPLAPGPAVRSGSKSPGIEARLAMLHRSEKVLRIAGPSRRGSAVGETLGQAGTVGDSEPLFGVRHSHADVAYSVQDWLRGARTMAGTGVATMLAESADPFIAQLAKSMSIRDDKVSRSGDDASPVIAAELDWLAADEAILHASEPHIIRCLGTGSGELASKAEARPGSEAASAGDPFARRSAPLVQPTAMLADLEWTAIAPAVAMRAHGFPFRSPCSAFYERYVVADAKMLARFGPTLQPIDPGASSDAAKRARLVQRAMCEMLATTLWKSLPSLAKHLPEVEDCVQVGKTRVFLTGRALALLEEARYAVVSGMDAAATRIQKVARGYLVRGRVRERWEAAVALQAAYRMWREQEAFLYFRHHGTVIALFVRSVMLRWRFLKMRQSAITIQSEWRRFRQVCRYARLQATAVQVQLLARGFLVRRSILARHAALLRIQRAARASIARNRIKWAQVRGALLLQAAFRGYIARKRMPDVVGRIRVFRVKLAKLRFFRRVVATWRGIMVRRRLLEISQAAVRLQRWILPRLGRLAFRKAWLAATKIQAIVRGSQTRTALANAEALNLAAEQAWGVQRLRAAERAVVEAVAENLHSLGFWQHIGSSDPGLVGLPTATKLPTFVSRALDVDVTADSGPHGVASLNAAENLEDGELLDEEEALASGLGSASELVGQLTTNNGSASWAATHESLEAALATRGDHTVSVAVGSTHSVVLDSAGRVHTWGWNDCGQLGAGRGQGGRIIAAKVAALSPGATLSASTPRQNPVWSPRARIVCIAAGADHTVALASTGVAYTWGANSRGQCGQGHFDTVWAPTAVKGLRRRISSAACGAHHTVFLTSAGSVYTCGAGRALGAGAFSDSADAGETTLKSNIPTPTGVAALAAHKITQVAAGWGHSVALAATGDVFAWGEGSRGQLGWATKDVRLAPCLVPVVEAFKHGHGKLASVPSRSVAMSGMSASRFTADAPLEDLVAEQEEAQFEVELRSALAARREARAERRRLLSEQRVAKAFRTGSSTDVSAAIDAHEAVPASLRCVAVACGGHHTLLLTDDGAVLAFGANDAGQLGVGDTDDRSWPCLVPGPWLSRNDDNDRVVSIEAGWKSSHVLLVCRSVMEWGHCGACAEDAVRSSTGPELDGSNPDTFLRPIIRTAPARVPLTHAEGYRVARLMASGSPTLSVSLAMFGALRTTERMVEAALARVAAQAAELCRPPSSPAPVGPSDARDEEALRPADPVASDADEAEALTQMLRAHPDLRARYGRALVAQRARAEREARTRQAAKAAGLGQEETERLVHQAKDPLTNDEEVIELAKAQHLHELLHRRKLLLMSERGAGTRDSKQEKELARKWMAMSIAERFAGLGLTARHLALLSHEQRARLAYALRQESHAGAKPFLAGVFVERKPAREALADGASAAGSPVGQRPAGGGSKRAAVASRRAAAPRVLEAVMPSPASRGGAPLAHVRSSPVRTSKATELALRARSELLGFNSFTIDVESPEAARAAAVRKSTRELMLQREDLAACTAKGAASAGSQAPPFASPIASRGTRHRFGFSRVAPATGTDPGVHAGVLLPGGRYDVALAQAEERILAQRLRDSQALKQQRVADAAKKLAQWRRAKEGPSRVDVASLLPMGPTPEQVATVLAAIAGKTLEEANVAIKQAISQRAEVRMVGRRVAGSEELEWFPVTRDLRPLRANVIVSAEGLVESIANFS
ncbi:hypothetical protein FNF28_02859 [Cafeteria roenbergensis]|uniref:Myosin motor domain-containing protein n=1 Tax=Cafeteria roenbergensis TaxID=33653 RepID=A0A5A8DRR3_CAFRO|nr:hypothetical protein FNF28_02859 [Cafeteria roenbergensis]